MIKKCPYCKIDLKKSGIYQLEHVKIRYYIDWVNDKGYCYGVVITEHSDIDKSTFHCAKCDELLDVGDEPFIN